MHSGTSSVNRKNNLLPSFLLVFFIYIPFLFICTTRVIHATPIRYNKRLTPDQIEAQALLDSENELDIEDVGVPKNDGPDNSGLKTLNSEDDFVNKNNDAVTNEALDDLYIHLEGRSDCFQVILLSKPKTQQDTDEYALSEEKLALINKLADKLYYSRILLPAQVEASNSKQGLLDYLFDFEKSYNEEETQSEEDLMRQAQLDRDLEENDGIDRDMLLRVDVQDSSNSNTATTTNFNIARSSYITSSGMWVLFPDFESANVKSGSNENVAYYVKGLRNGKLSLTLDVQEATRGFNIKNGCIQYLGTGNLVVLYENDVDEYYIVSSTINVHRNDNRFTVIDEVCLTAFDYVNYEFILDS
ncbi:uncharacterized protein SCDLUD_002401 [Saccharomycodes ludwigii]|uniref:uncharacterized protein n=1 Tax=Saccharomycodes ludwigii TaxID=36035 RepID=UPI001E8B5D14|nr:hypothetical protein SCDLUD_002401 [Saccharomycodes ludwigii]KAH3900940.1 hypothetical protein SCDLUD_002401 [Saccharomycodes ludwigii]